MEALGYTLAAAQLSDAVLAAQTVKTMQILYSAKISPACRAADDSDDILHPLLDRYDDPVFLRYSIPAICLTVADGA